MAATVGIRTRRAPAEARPTPRHPLLEVVRRPPTRPRQPWRRAVVVSATLAVGSLLAVAGSQAYLIEGQVRLVHLQQDLTVQSGAHRDLELRVAQLKQPSRIVSQAQRQGLDVPAVVKDLPQASVTSTSP